MGDLLVFRGGEVLVGTGAVPWMRHLMQRAVAASRVNGARDLDAEAFLEAFTAAQNRARCSAPGTARLPLGADLRPSMLIDPIGSEEAALMLGCTPENVRRLCRREALGAARLVGKSWQIERAEVAARMHERAG